VNSLYSAAVPDFLYVATVKELLDGTGAMPPKGTNLSLIDRVDSVVLFGRRSPRDIVVNGRVSAQSRLSDHERDTIVQALRSEAFMIR
jgi:hypothetical protein